MVLSAACNKVGPPNGSRIHHRRAVVLEPTGKAKLSSRGERADEGSRLVLAPIFPPFGPAELIADAILLDQQQTPLLVPLDSIPGGAQTGSFDEPGLELAIDVQNEDQVLRLEIAAYGRMMADPCSENPIAAEVDDVATVGVIGVAEVLAELLGAEIAQDGDLAMGMGPSHLGKLIEGKAEDTKPAPTPAGAGQDVGLGPGGLTE